MANSTDGGITPVRMRLPDADYEAFKQLAAADGMTVPGALAFLARWAVSQNSLCPISTAEGTVRSDLRTLARSIHQLRQRVDPDYAENSRGAEWRDAE